MRLFYSIISLLFLNFLGSDESKNEELSLQEALDNNLEALNKSLEENDANKDLKELLKSKEGRKQIEEMLKANKDDDEEDEDDEEMCNNKKKGYMKKSFDDTIEGYEDVIDANPILKSFAELTGKLIEKVESLEKSVKESTKKNEKNIEVLKSMGNVIVTSSELIKSTNDTIGKIGETPLEIPGRTGQAKVETILKSDSGEKVSYPDIKTALMKGFEAGKIPSTEISKWEMGRYDEKYLSPNTISLVKSYINGGN